MSVVVLLTAGVVVVVSLITGNDDAQAQAVTLSAGIAQTICYEPGGSMHANLIEGNRLPVLTVYAYLPSKGTGGAINVVQTVTGQKSRIGFFLGGAFSSESAETAQRYFLPDGPEISEGGICYQLTLLGNEGSSARVELGISDPMEN